MIHPAANDVGAFASVLRQKGSCRLFHNAFSAIGSFTAIEMISSIAMRFGRGAELNCRNARRTFHACRNVAGFAHLEGGGDYVNSAAIIE